MSFFERLERIEKQIEACHKAACDQSLSKQEQAGALVGWMDWQTARTMLLEEMEAAERRIAA